MPDDDEPDYDLYTKAMYVYKALLDKHARAHGGTVTYLSQHSVIWGLKERKSVLLNKGDYKGLCAGLAIEWVKATLNGKDFIDALNTARNEIMSTRLEKDTRDFITAIASAHTSQFEVGKELAKEATVKKTVSVRYPFGGATKNFEDGYFYYLGTKAHATAAFCNGETLTFYDPNVGVANGVQKKMVGAYFKELIEETLRLGNKSVLRAIKAELKIVSFKPL